MDELSKYNISLGLNNDLNKKTILIDCMNTIIYRDCSLISILKEWSIIVGREFGIHSAYLFNYRVGVLGGAMHNVVDIETIYSEIADQCIFFGIINDEERSLFSKRAHEIEVECELKSHHLYNDTKAFLKKEKDKNHSIYCVSDFRLSSSDIWRFFKKQKIDSLFTAVFSSSEFGSTKKKGDLYNIVLQKIGTDAGNCIMLGDNLKSDCINATQVGIKSYFLKRERQE